MIKEYAKRRSLMLLEAYPHIIQDADNAYDIIQKTYGKYKKHIKIERIIEFLVSFDNLPKFFNAEIVIYYQDKIIERINKLRSEGKHQSVIDLSLYEIFSKTVDDAKIAYERMIKDKTEVFRTMCGSKKDSRTLDFHIRKYGKEEGIRIHTEKKNNGYFKRTANTCVEYYIERGYTEEDARKIISERQAVGRLDRYIKKYGEKEGVIKWQERQIKWQKTLNSRDKDDIIETNMKKDPIYAYKSSGYDKSKIVELLTKDKRKFNYKLYDNLESFDEKIKEDIENSKLYNYMHPKDFPPLYCHTQFQLLDINDPIEFMKRYIIVDETRSGDVVQHNSQYRNYTMKINEGYLRSSFEILFYNLLKGRGIKFLLDNKYPIENNPGSWRYDFYLPEYEKYIEISPLYNTVKDVREKIDTKKKLFDCVVLTNKEEISRYIDSLPDLL